MTTSERVVQVVAGFDKEIASCQKKTTDYPKEESITENPEQEPVTEDPKEDPITEKPKTVSMRTIRSFKTLKEFCAAKKLFLAFW